MKHLYVCSRPTLGSDGELHQHLIGILTYHKRQFSFHYRLDDSKASQLLMLPIFPHIKKVYNDEETRVLLDDYLPSETNTAFISEILKKTNMSEYNEWAWLCAFDAIDVDTVDTQLYETLSDDIIRHDEDLPDIEDDVLFDDSENDDDESEYDDTEPYFDSEDIDDEDDDIDIGEDPDDEFDDIDTVDTVDIDEINNDDEDDEDNTSTTNEFDEDFDVDDLLGDLINNDTSDKPAVTGTLVQKLAPKPAPNKIKVVAIKTTQRITSQNGDIIQSALTSPMTEIQRRLEENAKARKEKLNKELEKPFGQSI